MRLNKLLTVALASMMMFSCSNNDEMDNGLSNGEKKAVILRLDGVSTPKTRSTDANTGSGDNDKKMSLSSIKVYFCNSTNIYSTKDYKSTETDTWAKLVGENAGESGYQEIVEVNAAVDRVIIVGNPDTSTFGDIATVEALEGKVLSLSKENTPISAGETTKSNVTLYGTAPLTPVADGTTANYTHTAAVTIAPLISRIEVTGVSCTFQESEATAHRFNKVTVTGIGMVDYNNKMTIAGTASEPMTPYTANNESGNIYKPDYSETVTNGYKFCVEDDTWGWSFDIKKGNENLSIVFEANTQQTAGTTDTQHTFAYNFFVPETDPKFPNIMLVATVETPQSTSRAALPNKYVTTTDWGAVTPQRGYIYTFEYAFNENDLGEWDEKDIKKVLVTVTATPWTIEAVTPDFN